MILPDSLQFCLQALIQDEISEHYSGSNNMDIVSEREMYLDYYKGDENLWYR